LVVFFSSRRRHTISKRDWSSDVCSSDLSVHLASWPEYRPELVDTELSKHMALTRRLVELGRSARVDSSVRTRQPLGRALVGVPGFADLPEQLRDQIADELNVESLESLSSVGQDLVDHTVKPNFRA